MADSSGNRTSSANGSNKKDIFVKEELKIAVKLSLDKFRYDEDRKGKVPGNFAFAFRVEGFSKQNISLVAVFSGPYSLTCF